MLVNGIKKILCVYLITLYSVVMAAENPELNNSADEEFFSSAEGETQDMLQDEGNSADIYSKNTSIWEGNEGNYEKT